MYFSGQNGSLEISEPTGSYTEVGRIRNWSYSSQQQSIDTTCLKDTDKTIINGVRSITGQASLLYYEETVSNIDLLGSKLISPGGTSFDSPDFGANGVAKQPQLCRIRLSISGGKTSKARAVGMYAYLTSFSMSCSVGEVVSADISWEGHGAPFEWIY